MKNKVKGIILTIAALVVSYFLGHIIFQMGLVDTEPTNAVLQIILGLIALGGIGIIVALVIGVLTILGLIYVFTRPYFDNDIPPTSK